MATPAALPAEKVFEAPRAAEPETRAEGVEADPELRDAVDGTKRCTPAPLPLVDVRPVPGSVVGTDGTLTGGIGTGAVVAGGIGTGAVVTVGTVTDGRVTVGTGTDGVVIPGTETVTEGTVSATLTRGKQQRESGQGNARGPARDTPAHPGPLATRHQPPSHCVE